MADLSNSDNDNDILEMNLLKPSISRQSSNDYIESITIQDDDGSDMNDNNYNNSLIESQHLSDEIEQNISESLDDLTTTTTTTIKTMKLLHDDTDFLGHFHKKVRVGNHYQARIPKYVDNNCNDNDDDDKLLWKPSDIDPIIVEDFLKRLSKSTKLLIPMGKHLRDNEYALYTLQKNNYNVDETINTIVNNTNNNLSFTTNEKITNSWTEEECKNFELGLVRFGKNFYLIQKRRLNTRTVGELVQFYYLWKKSERYDLFANRLRSGKKKYTLNPGISDLMMKYFKTTKIKQNDDNEDDNMSDVQFYFNEDK